MTVRTPASWEQNGAHPAENDRLTLAGLVNPGIVGAADLLVSAPGGMSVSVAAGKAFIAGTEVATQGTYGFTNDAAVALAVAASDPVNPRHDLVVAQVRDDAYSGAFHDALLAVVAGVAAGVPVDPAVPNNALVLA